MIEIILLTIFALVLSIFLFVSFIRYIKNYIEKKDIELKNLRRQSLKKEEVLKPEVNLIKKPLKQDKKIEEQISKTDKKDITTTPRRQSDQNNLKELKSDKKGNNIVPIVIESTNSKKIPICPENYDSKNIKHAHKADKISNFLYSEIAKIGTEVKSYYEQILKDFNANKDTTDIGQEFDKWRKDWMKLNHPDHFNREEQKDIKVVSEKLTTIINEFNEYIRDLLRFTKGSKENDNCIFLLKKFIAKIDKEILQNDELEFKELVKVLDEMNEKLKELFNGVKEWDEKHAKLREGLKGANEELKGINEELKGANEELKGAKEELKGANEELKGAKEGLKVTKESLKKLEEELIKSEEESKQMEIRLKILDSKLDSKLEESNNS